MYVVKIFKSTINISFLASKSHNVTTDADNYIVGRTAVLI